MFPEAEVIHEISGMSDHAPIVIKWEGMKAKGKLRLFRYEPMWLKHKEYGEKIRCIWEQCARGNSSLSDCLSSSATALDAWGRSCFGNVNKKVSYLNEKLKRIQQQERTREMMEEEAKVTEEVDEWLYKQELYWKQRSRIDWLKEDKRRSLSRIQQEVSFVPQCVTEDMAAILNAPFSELEVQDAIFQINPKKIEEYRPISLCNVPIKIVTKKLRQEQEESNLRGIKICRGAPEVTHLLLADDNIIFLRASLEDAANLRKILALYEEISGQKVNVTKSEICFSRNVSPEMKGRICEMLEMRQVNSFSKYLGLPVAFSNNKTELFKLIVDRTWQKVQEWKEQTLSMAGKETLIKSVLQTIPTYAMMCFKLPVYLCKRLAGIVSKYWWNNKGGDKCIYWGSYKLLCKPKEVGGLGWRDFELFNEALLAKQVWRSQSDLDALVSRMLKAKYFSDSNVLQSQLGNRPSLAWRSIWNEKNRVSRWFSLEGSPPKLAWTMQDSGVFSVKSSYESPRRESELLVTDLKGEQANKDSLKSFWRKLWRLKVQPKFLDQDISIIMQGARQISFNRNLVVNGKGALNPYVEAAALRESVLWNQKLENSLVVTSLVGNDSWQPSENGFLKINVDGAWDRESGKTGIGLCCRDSEGVVLFVVAESTPSVESSVEVELRSLQRSLELTESMGLKRVIFELDNAVVFNAIQNRSSSAMVVAGRLSRCRHLLGRNSCWFLSLIPREANAVADKLAKKAKGGVWRWTNLEAIPMDVL
ncbi:hypothetical protein QQ045_007085 [Rhodiola kirilowii]